MTALLFVFLISTFLPAYITDGHWVVSSDVHKGFCVRWTGRVIVVHRWTWFGQSLRISRRPRQVSLVNWVLQVVGLCQCRQLASKPLVIRRSSRHGCSMPIAALVPPVLQTRIRWSALTDKRSGRFDVDCMGRVEICMDVMQWKRILFSLWRFGPAISFPHVFLSSAITFAACHEENPLLH